MATLAVTARTAASISVNLTAGAGETTWEVEINRSADFASDESIAYARGAAGAFDILDLVADTPYFIRARKTNAGLGNWSATLIAATLPAAAAPPYIGWSIEPAILVVPEPIGSFVATNGEAGNSWAQGLLNDDPLATWRSLGATTFTFRLPGRPIDVIAILGTLANEAVTWRIRAAAVEADVLAAPAIDTGVVPFRISTGIGRRKHYHAYRRLAAPSTLEFWRIDIAGCTNFFMARHLVVGLARQSVNVSRGAGHSPLDMGSFSRNVVGSPDRVSGWRGRTVDFPLSWLSEAEYETKWRDLDQLVGMTDSVLALPNPKANVFLNDRIAYGPISDSRSELMRGDKWSRNLTIASLY